MRLENWYVLGNVIVGDIYEDEKGRFPDGLNVHTSTVQNMRDDFKQGDVINTRNSTYELGKAYKT